MQHSTLLFERGVIKSGSQGVLYESWGGVINPLGEDVENSPS